jgi:hypothetical protein
VTCWGLLRSQRCRQRAPSASEVRARPAPRGPAALLAESLAPALRFAPASPVTPQLSSSVDSRATHARTLMPAALAFVLFEFV